MVGSNKDEGTFFLQPTTAEKFIERARGRFGDQADAFLKLYPAGSDEEANASQLAAFRDELAFVMRIWARAQTKTGLPKRSSITSLMSLRRPWARSSRRLRFGRDARRGGPIHFPKPASAARVDGPGSSSLGHAVVVLGELRDQWRSERKGLWRSGRPMTIKRATGRWYWAIEPKLGQRRIARSLRFSNRFTRRNAEAEH